MAKNSITFKVKVEKDGNLKVIAKDSEKAAKGTEKLGKSTDQTTKARNNFSRGEKGVAQAGMNTTKSFSKMRDAMGSGSSGLVGAYATLAANVFALTAAFGILQRASAAQQLAEGLEYTGQVAGRNLPYIANQLKEITGAAVSTQEAMTAVATATAAGFSSSQIAALGNVAKGASLALGRDMTDALNRLIKGSAKLEPELLDELGIMVRLDDAARDYASQLGTTVENLTQYQKRQAFVNAVIEEGTRNFSGIADAIQPNAYDQLSAALADLLKDSVQFINKGLAPMARFFSNSTAGLVGGVILFASTIRGALLPGLTQGAQRMANFAAESKAAAAASFGNVQTTGKLPKVYTELAAKIQDGTATTKDFTKAQNSLAGSLRKHNSDLENHANFQDTSTTKYAQKIVTISEVENAQSKLNNTLVLSAKAETANAKAAAINSAAQLNVVGTIKNVRLAMAAYRLEITAIATANGAATASFAGLRVALFGAATGFAALGVGILTVLPFLALIPLLFGAMKTAWDKFFGDSSTVKKQQEIFDSLEHINEVGIRLNKTLMDIELRKPPTAGWDTFTAKLTAAAGAAAQIRDRVGDAVNVQLEAKALAIAEAMGKVDKAQERLNAVPAGGSLLLAGKRARALEIEKATLDKLEDSYNKIDVKPLIDGLEKALIVSRALGEDAGIIRHTQNQIDKLKELGETADAIDIGKVMSPPSGAETTATLLESFEAGLSSFSEEYGKFSAKVSTPFDKMSAGLDEAIKSLTQTTEIKGFGGRITTVLTQEAAELQKQLEDGETPLSKFVEKLKMDDVKETGLQTLERVNSAIQDQIEKIQQTPALIAKEQAELSKLNEVRKVSGELTTKAHAMEDEIIRLKDESLNASIKVLEALNLTGKKTAEILKLETEIIANQAKKKSPMQKELEVLQGQQGLKKLMLAQDQKALDIIKQTTARRKKALTEEAKARNRADPMRGFNPELNAKDRLEIEKKLKLVRKQAIRDEFEILLNRHNMEYDLLEAKRKLMVEQAKAAGLELKSLENYGKTLETMRTKGQTNLINNRNAQINTVDADTAAGGDSVTSDVLGATGSSALEVLMNQNEAGGIASIKETTQALEAMGNVIEPLMNNLRKLGPEGEVIAAVGEGSMNILQSFSHLHDTIKAFGESTATASEVTVAKLQVLGTAVQAIGSILQAQSNARIASIDAEINAEKRRDGKSKESQAKIQQLEKKKVAAQKKAFEINKKVQMATVAINTASAMVAATAAAATASIPAGPGAPAVFKAVLGMMGGIILAVGAAQIALIAGTSFQGGGNLGGGAASGGGGTVSVGQRGTSSDLNKSQSAPGELAYFRGDQGIGGAENFRPAFYGKKNRAMGGNTGYVVGEQGPELFMPDRPGTIVPADDTATIGGNTNVTFSINAIDATGVEDVLVAQQGNIIGMIRQAANSYGEDFLEDLDESTYTSPVARRA